MRYLMIRDAKGAADEAGTSVREYRAGETYTLPRAVADAFLASGACKPADEAPKAEPQPEPKPDEALAPGPSETKPARPSRKK